MEYNFSYETGALIERTFVVTADTEAEAIELFSKSRIEVDNRVKETEPTIIEIAEDEEETEDTLETDLYFIEKGEFKTKKVTIEFSS